MTVSRLRVAKSETREFGEQDRLRRLDEPTEWHMQSHTFFIAFVAITAALTVLGFVLRYR
ncbi:MAG TPA: hypothetical protein VGM88_13650 [Kofleriaceae bacterium]|jgi:hypothetical protein